MTEVSGGNFLAAKKLKRHKNETESVYRMLAGSGHEIKGNGVRRNRRWILIGGLTLVVFGITSIFIWYTCSRHPRPQESFPSQIIPPPPPFLQNATNSPSPIDFRKSRFTKAVDASEILQYDDDLSFDANLDHFRRFCDANKEHSDFDFLIGPFIKPFILKSRNNFDSICNALEKLEGTPPYRNILLACLMSADAPAESKADVAWGVAINMNEDASVRRTAVYLTGQVDSVTKRPEEFRLLLTDPDEQVVVFALTSINRNTNLDETSYDLIKTSLINSTNVNLQVAAVNAIGTAPFADSQDVLFKLVTNAWTTEAEPFSEPTLAKRSAIMLLDINNAQTQQLLQTIALDDTEEPGVRSKAITRMATSPTPEVTRILQELLDYLDPDNLVPLRAVVDGLMREPSPENLLLVMDKIGSITDPQVRRVLLHRVEMATKGENQ